MRSDLHVFTARANPLRWQQPHKHYLAFAEAMLDFGVTLTVIECQYGDRPFACELPHVRHIGVRATTPVWSKENLLISRSGAPPRRRTSCSITSASRGR